MRKATAKKKLQKLFKAASQIIEDSGIIDSEIHLTCTGCGEVHTIIKIESLDNKSIQEMNQNHAEAYH